MRVDKHSDDDDTDSETRCSDADSHSNRHVWNNIFFHCIEFLILQIICYEFCWYDLCSLDFLSLFTVQNKFEINEKDVFLTNILSIVVLKLLHIYSASVVY